MATNDREKSSKPGPLKDDFVFKRLCAELDKLTPDRRAAAMEHIDKQEPVMMKTEEVAALMGVEIDTVRRWLRTGKLRGVRIGKRYFISKEEIERITA
jgi:excisionase family DNA binding protein